MASLSDQRTVERQRFFDGQQLLAADLNTVVDHHRWRRELHNRSLHQPGIANGFAVVGARGDREVTVGAGYALDAEGREIISTRERREPVPPVAGDPGGGPAFYDLTVAYPDTADLEEAETRRGVCGDRGTVRLLEDPKLCWVPLVQSASGELHAASATQASAIETGHSLRLARIGVLDCRLDSLSIAERRNARPPTQPHLACGHVSPDWQVEIEPAGDGEPPAVYFRATVDTSASGFRTTPCYSARLGGPRSVQVTSGEFALDLFADGLVTLEEPGPAGFAVRVRALLVLPPSGLGELSADDLSVPWTLHWMGLEP